VGAGSAEGSLDAASILKPALSRGDVQCIGATTPREYHRHIEKDRPLVRRFQPIQIAPPSTEETVKILFGLRERYQKFHRVRFTDEAMRTAVAQSSRFITDRFLPDKAIDVMDEAGAWARLKGEGLSPDARPARSPETGPVEMILVGKEEVEEVISRWTGIPLSSVKKEEAEKLMRMEDHLHRRLVGQEEAISGLARAIRRSRAGLRSPLRPVGSFVFLGPTGVGKTETARTLAEFLFGNERALIRFDMSEYMEKHAVARMIGSPPGYVGYEEGGLLTEAVKRRPYSVLLLDEIEKAHPEVLHILLQVLEDGRLTDSWGDVVDFRNVLIIMTSNIGSGSILSGAQLGFAAAERGAEFRKRKDLVMKEVRRHLNPEFLNRIDEIVVFDALAEDELLEIAKRMLDELNRSLTDRSLRLRASDEVYHWLIETTCADRSFGARPLRRAIQRHIEDGISEQLIVGRLPAEGEIEITIEDGKPAFRAVMEMEPTR
jgi:ATP-dependent Clp protease ATP-binding subunit ClpC